MKLQSLLLVLMVVFGLNAHAFFTVMETGELQNKGYYRVTGDAQFILSEPNDGFNANGKFAMGLNQESDIEAEIGFGSVDMYVAGYWKWIPYPDTRNQPALGGRFGFTFADINDVTTYGLQATPLVSKTIDGGKIGKFIPYAALPIGLQNNNDDTFLTMQFVIGTEYTYPTLRHIHFLIEYGFDVDDAFDHLSIGAAFDI